MRTNPTEPGVISISCESIADNIMIRIRDNGVGIPKDILNKIYEPFFTTKDVGEGTGLGLSIVYGIIQDHKGRIEVNSEENKFTAFTITLPIHILKK
jgi:signal transduction histidine kinase